MPLVDARRERLRGEAARELRALQLDPRQLAVRHGLRPQDGLAEFTAATAPHTDYLNQKLTGIRQVNTPTVKILMTLAARAKAQGDTP